MVSQVLRSCARCGTPGDGPDDGMPEGWSLDVDPDRGPSGRQSGDRRVRYLCGTCTRDNVRSIEAKLPQEWWE
jgi:hypothetical protein